MGPETTRRLVSQRLSRRCSRPGEPQTATVMPGARPRASPYQWISNYASPPALKGAERRTPRVRRSAVSISYNRRSDLNQPAVQSLQALRLHFFGLFVYINLALPAASNHIRSPLCYLLFLQPSVLFAPMARPSLTSKPSGSYSRSMSHASRIHPVAVSRWSPRHPKRL